METKTEKAYKVFNEDWTCRGFKYKIGETYKHKGDIEICGSGFHSCKKICDCFNYYSFNPKNKLAEVEILGVIIHGDDKSVSSEIKIMREIKWLEVLDIANTGKNNSGNTNLKTWVNYNKPRFINTNLKTWVNILYMKKINNKDVKYKEAWKIFWDNAKTKSNWSEEYNKLINLPNFDKEVFFDITGIDIDKD